VYFPSTEVERVIRSLCITQKEKDKD